MPGEPLHAVIGVCRDGLKTLYVKRSDKMANYPGVWSLLSIQFKPEDLPDPANRLGVFPIFQRMTRERLGNPALLVNRYLSSSTRTKNALDRRVTLHMYELSLLAEPKLNPDFYTEAAWLIPEQYAERAAGQTCGTCMRMWSDYCVRNGLAKERFAPALEIEDDQTAASS